ncbi:NPHN protein, partial [Bucco capensis]|nr:NPHN protein [Bucco capensis]
ENWEQEENHTLGIFICVAQNPLGIIRRRLQLRLADRPDPPQELEVTEVTSSSLRITWKPGFDGGLSQTFLVSARSPGAPPSATLLASGPSLTLEGLLPATPYDVIVRGRNARGESAPSRAKVVTA